MKSIETKAYSVSQITSLIRNTLETTFQGIWIEGEISNLKIPSSGHIYFILKDETSQIRAVAFRHKNRFFNFQPQDGMKVLIQGRVTVYESRGEYQILVEHIEPRGKGALQIAFEQLKVKLKAEGLFAPEAKKPIPPYPEVIGIITSPTGAAIQDMLKIIHRRFTGVKIIINPVKVQGEEAAAEIARAIEELNNFSGIDVLIIGRGGGSMEDLWAFNEELVARAIFQSRIPVISAVGHEIDFTISDFVADLRAPTPSAAAELVVKNKQELIEKINFLQKKMHKNIRHQLDLFSHRLNWCAQSRFFQYPDRFLYPYHQAIDGLELRLRQGISRQYTVAGDKSRYLTEVLSRFTPLSRIQKFQEKITHLSEKLYHLEMNYLKDQRAALSQLAGKLDSLSPLAVLSRGYSICRKLPDLEVVTEASSLEPRDYVNIKLHHGEIICEVKGHG